ncbi:MAG: DNA repair protein RecN [Thermincola sp.]|nr:DNA repair protein RecN [Thermincola sp.]MDT3703669.1 DNA repair protein RecN [Thermincola sp.]
MIKLLKKLFIKNFALIEKLEIEFMSGFSVMTGETGAGKSIVIDAVDVAIGGQGLTEFIRSGEEKAVIEAYFEIDGHGRVKELLELYGYLQEDGEYLILTREIVKTGKNVCRLNGRQVNLSLYKDISQLLVDIYGQHHQQSLLDPQKHIELLDEYGGLPLLSLKHKVAEHYNHYEHLKNRVKELVNSEKDQARMADVYRYQWEEIEKTGLQPDEDVSLAEEKNILSHAEKLAYLTNSAYELLYEGNKSKAVTDLLYDAVNACREAGEIDESLRPVCEALETALYQIEDASRQVKAYSERVEADPVRLEEVENRLDTIARLKKKYGQTIVEILEYKEKAAASMTIFENYGEELQKLKDSLDIVESQFNQAAGALSQARQTTAERLKAQITAELQELNMPNVSFDVSLKLKESPAANGLDDIEFLISANRGEPLKPLAKVISGGEASRIMLAFKTILAKLDAVSTLIFDEVDAGIGGHALQAVARKLSYIGRDRQVICVTHAPQIAGSGDHHYMAEKSVISGRTITSVRKLESPERVDELARMLAGGQVTDAARKHAEEIINSGNN